MRCPQLGDISLVFVTHLVHSVLCHQAPSYSQSTGHMHQAPQDRTTGHMHQAPQDRPTGFHDPKVVQDQDHIKEHLDGVADLGDKDMSTEELQFHYFKLHDFDNNTMLDGLEIYKALTHLLPFDQINDEAVKVDPKGKSPSRILEEQTIAEQKYYTDIVDQVLQEDDYDGDGYLSYLEFVLASRREDQRQRGKPNKL